MRSLILVLTALLALVTAAQAQTPKPRFSPPVFRNGPTHHAPVSANGSACTRNGVAAQQQTINPITGQRQAQTLVSIPVGKGSGSVADATTRRQQLEACAHPH
jgi:hypothetical protein